VKVGIAVSVQGTTVIGIELLRLLPLVGIDTVMRLVVETLLTLVASIFIFINGMGS
jgi:hypothetical protein